MHELGDKAKRLAEERYQAGYQAGLLVKGPMIVVSYPDKSRDYARGFADGVREAARRDTESQKG